MTFGYLAFLPVALLLLLGVVEYGWYYMQQDEANRQVAVAAQRIKLSPRTAEKPTFDGSFFDGSLCAVTSAGPPDANATCGNSWDLGASGLNSAGNPILNHHALIHAQGNFQSLTGFLDNLFPTQVSARQVIRLSTRDCSYQAFLNHPGCKITYRKRTYGGCGASGTNATSNGFVSWGNWFMPKCVDGDLICDLGSYPASLQNSNSRGNFGVVTLQPGPHMCSSTHTRGGAHGGHATSIHGFDEETHHELHEERSEPPTSEEPASDFPQSDLWERFYDRWGGRGGGD